MTPNVEAAGFTGLDDNLWNGIKLYGHRQYDPRNFEVRGFGKTLSGPKMSMRLSCPI